jgi:hypothetical protein
MQDGTLPDDEAAEDHNFASEVVIRRKLLPVYLKAAYMEMRAEIGVSQRDVLRTVEYLLNRINYPLCGQR